MNVGRFLAASSVHHDDPPFRRLRREGVFSLLVSAPPGARFTLDARILHRDLADSLWGLAGAFAPITAPGMYCLPLDDLREELRYAYSASGFPSTAALRVTPLPPRWGFGAASGREEATVCSNGKARSA